MRKTMHQLRQSKREERMVELNESVSDGSLRIRQMTEEERAQHSLARDGRFAAQASRRSSAPQPRE